MVNTSKLKELILENKSISIELPVAAWNIVMNALGARPYAEVVEVIQSVKQQAEASLRLAEASLRPAEGQPKEQSSTNQE